MPDWLDQMYDTILMNQLTRQYGRTLSMSERSLRDRSNRNTNILPMDMYRPRPYSSSVNETFQSISMDPDEGPYSMGAYCQADIIALLQLSNDESEKENRHVRIVAMSLNCHQGVLREMIYGDPSGVTTRIALKRYLEYSLSPTILFDSNYLG